jgi:LCP family protein required for cell wall assembly
MDESGELSDVDWVLQFDLIAGSMNILQIPRDSYMPDYASYSTTKFNSIYHSGQETGVTPIQRVVNAIQENFCIYVDAYVKLNCVDIANIVDSVGGIPITLPEQITYEADKILPAGEQTLNGQQSEWFVRFRHGYAEGDIGRVKAQRIFLAAAMEKMLNMSQTELMSAMQKIYKNQWIATDLSLEQISMVADFASQRLTMDNVNVFMVPGEGATYYPGDGSSQSVYSIHKSATVDLLNQYFRPYQNEIYPEESTIVELVPEGEYLARDYDDTQENLGDINKGDSNDGAQ